MIGLSLSLAVAVAAMARQEGQTDKKGHTVARHRLRHRCGRLKIELFLPFSPSILSKGAEQTVKRGFRSAVRCSGGGR